jgi:hypothetical protein
LLWIIVVLEEVEGVVDELGSVVVVYELGILQDWDVGWMVVGWWGK